MVDSIGRHPWMAPENSWYALAGSIDLPCESMLPIMLLGQRLALWRDGDGQAHLWSDRCPHRGSRLTIGRIANGELMCRYHGWRYGSDGICIAIPALPDLVPSANLRVQTFKVREQFGLIWGSLGDSPGELALDGFGASERSDVFCRTFPVSVPAPAFICHVLNFKFVPYVQRQGAIFTHSYSSSPSFVKVRYSEGVASEIAAICVQPASEQRCMAHLVVSLEATGVDVSAARRHFNRQFERIRYRAENQPVEERI